jgi:hypothetical protein
MSFVILDATPSSDVASGATITFAYPDGYDAGSFYAGYGHKLNVRGLQTVFSAPADFTVAFTTLATVTYNGDTAIPAGTLVQLQAEVLGQADGEPKFDRDSLRSSAGLVSIVRLGAPLTADTDSMIKAATSTELPDTETITYTPDTDATSPTDGVGPVVTINGVDYWEMDVPRNVHCTTTHASSIVAMTIVATGLDEYGEAMSETISVAATGTSEVDQGVKAFKHVRSIAITAASDAAANTINIGFGDVLGLPVFLAEKALIVRELQDGALATAGTALAGVTSVATATTGDVRGTYDPNAACDGSKVFHLVVVQADPTFFGVDQYAG